jgi:putative heme-binding domain-containing protein
LARSDEPALRREAALAMRDWPSNDALPVLMEIARRYDGQDRFYLEAFGIGADGKEEALYSELVESLGAGEPFEWSDAFARLVWRLHPVGAVAAVAARARADSLSIEARKLAIDTLAFTSDPSAPAPAEAMIELALRGSNDEVRRYALWWARHRAGNDWKSFDIASRLEPETLSHAERLALARVQALRHVVLSNKAPCAERTKAAASLAVTKEGGLALIALAQQKRLPEDVRETVTDAIYRNPDFGVRALASQYFTRTSFAGKTLPPIAELAKVRGDATRGRALFNGQTAGCAQCHRFGTEGRDVGPDLSAIRAKFDKAGVLDAILNPSAAIAFGYEPWIITTQDDETYTGFLLADGDPVVLKETSGAERRLAARQIVSREKQTLSIMPDNIALGLSPQDLADLVEFLLAPDGAAGKTGSEQVR